MKIISATYGNVDCADKLTDRIRNGRLFTHINNGIIGDPLSGQVKTLHLTYEIDGIVNELEAKEGDFISIPKSSHRRLGIWYTNNNSQANSKAINESLKSIVEASNGVADIITSVWHPINANDFYQAISHTQHSSHLNQLLQILQLLYIAKLYGKYDYVSFLEHDVLYPVGYFQYDNFDQGTILTNMNYGGLCKSGWQNRKQDDEPFHQMTMRFEDAIKHCESILPNALINNSGLIEPQSMTRQQWNCENQAVHINHGKHFTSHYSIYDSENTYTLHPYWGDSTLFEYVFK